MTNLRADEAVVVVKKEAEAGVRETLNPATDAILVENFDISFDPNIVQPDEKTGTLDPAAPIVGGIKASITFECWLKGTSAAGTAPQWGTLMQLAGYQEVITATAAPDPAEAATAGSATTLTLGTNAAAVLNAYRGMPINLTGNPAAGALDFITDYTATKVATLGENHDPVLSNTTQYQIPANVLYRPASDSLPAGSIDVYKGGVKYEFTGCVADVSIQADAGGAAKLTFTVSGLLTAQGKVNASVPSAAYDSDANGDIIAPPVWKNGKMFIDRVARGLSQFSIAANNEIDFAPNPNKTEGYDAPTIRRRRISGTVDPNEVLLATSNLFAAMRAGTKFPMVAQAGTVVGNRWGITVPSAQATNFTPGDRNRDSISTIPYAATGPEKGFFLSIF